MRRPPVLDLGPVVHVAPAQGVPYWWHVTDLEGRSFAGSFPWAINAEPPEAERAERDELARGEKGPHLWRFAGSSEVAAVLWFALVDRELEPPRS